MIDQERIARVFRLGEVPGDGDFQIVETASRSTVYGGDEKPYERREAVTVFEVIGPRGPLDRFATGAEAVAFIDALVFAREYPHMLSADG